MSVVEAPQGVRLEALTSYLLRNQVTSILVWGLALGLLNVLTVLVFPAFKDTINSELAHIPPSARALFGAQETGSTIRSWLALNTFNLLAPLALSFYPILIGARAIAGREESGSMDLLLSNPLPRRLLIAATLLTMGISLLAILVIFGLLTWLPTLPINVHLTVASTAAAVLNLWPLCMVFGAGALLCSALVRRSTQAIVIPGAVLFAMYVINALASASRSLRFLQRLSLFFYYDTAIERGIPWTAFIVISLLALGLGILAALAFNRRDVYA